MIGKKRGNDWLSPDIEFQEYVPPYKTPKLHLGDWACCYRWCVYNVAVPWRRAEVIEISDDSDEEYIPSDSSESEEDLKEKFWIRKRNFNNLAYRLVFESTTGSRLRELCEVCGYNEIHCFPARLTERDGKALFVCNTCYKRKKQLIKAKLSHLHEERFGKKCFPCVLCSHRQITPFDFHMAHVVSLSEKRKDGKEEACWLWEIVATCAKCNVCMLEKDFETYIREYHARDEKKIQNVLAKVNRIMKKTKIMCQKLIQGIE
jgi:hypothetical protein